MRGERDEWVVKEDILILLSRCSDQMDVVLWKGLCVCHKTEISW